MKSAAPKTLEWIRGRALTLLAVLSANPLRALDVLEWKNRQSLAIDRAGIVALAVPPETLDAARADYGDIRIVDAAGQEVAFALQPGTRPPVRPVAAKSFRSNLTASATELVIECGDFPVTEVVLETPAPEFVKRGRVDTSSDGVAWQLAEEGVPIFRQNGVARLNVPPLARFLRITLDDSRSRPVPFTGAKITPATSAMALVHPLTTRIARREEFAGETVLTLDVAAAHVPLDTLALTTPEQLFTRRVSVGVRELRDESAVERTSAHGTIYRVPVDGGGASGDTFIPLGFTAPARELLVHIANDDSPPLAITAVTITRFEVWLYFNAAAPGDYTLLTGHPHVNAPRYDLGRLRLGKTPQTTNVTVGALRQNPGYRAPEALAGTALLGAALDPAAWSYRKVVQLVAAGVQQLEFDLDVLVHAQPGFADVRLLREGAQVPYLIERPALSRSLDLPIAGANDPKRPRLSRWEIKLPRPGLPLTRLTLTSPSGLFQRQLHVSEKISDDRGNTFDRALAFAVWSRTPGEHRPLTIPFTTAPTTDTLIVETDNGDNPPIVLGAASATRPVTRLLFKAEPVSSAVNPSNGLALYYGNRAVAAPRYDLALVAGEILAAEKTVAALGAEERMKAEGWTKTALGGGRGGILFWSVLGLVVAVLLTVVAKLLPKTPG